MLLTYYVGGADKQTNRGLQIRTPAAEKSWVMRRSRPSGTASLGRWDSGDPTAEKEPASGSPRVQNW